MGIFLKIWNVSPILCQENNFYNFVRIQADLPRYAFNKRMIPKMGDPRFYIDPTTTRNTMDVEPSEF
jgi:hypothetical protein